MNQAPNIQRAVTMGWVSFSKPICKRSYKHHHHTPEQNKEYWRKYHREYRQKNLTRIRAYQKMWRKSHPRRFGRRPYLSSGLTVSQFEDYNAYRRAYMAIWRARRNQNHN